MKGLENTQDKACEKLRRETQEMENAKLRGAEQYMRREIASAVGAQLLRFVNADDSGDLAAAVLRDDKKLKECVGTIVDGIKRENPAVSDADVYTKAVKYYLPEASVRCTIRCIIPQELDDDLSFIGTGVEDEPELGGAAKILDFFVGGD